MPELPEVETIRRQLLKEVVGEVIEEVEVRDVKCFEGKASELRGEKIVKVSRLGKYLIFSFESGKGMEVHLKMTGRLVVDDEYDKMAHTRVVIKFRSGKKLYYWDTRKFGYLRVVSKVFRLLNKLREKLGPDPWMAKEEYILGVFRKTSRAVKNVIIDQKVLAGIGNIYANDALWLARVRPMREAKSLSKREVNRLMDAIREVLERGLETKGASNDTYRDVYGYQGGYQDEFLVYGRTNEKCLECGEGLERVVVGGRGTWFCRKCQR